MLGELVLGNLRKCIINGGVQLCQKGLFCSTDAIKMTVERLGRVLILYPRVTFQPFAAFGGKFNHGHSMTRGTSLRRKLRKMMSLHVPRQFSLLSSKLHLSSTGAGASCTTPHVNTCLTRTFASCGARKKYPHKHVQVSIILSLFPRKFGRIFPRAHLPVFAPSYDTLY